MSAGNSLAMMPWFPRDWLTATRLMSLAQRGAYSDLLFYQWELGTLPSSASGLLRLLGCSQAEFDEVWPGIVDKFVVNGQFMQNERLEEHRTKSKQLKSDKSLAGKAGGIKSGEARRSKREADPQAAARRSANGSASSKTQAPSPSPSPTSKKPTPTPPKGGAVRERRSPRRAELDEARCKWRALLQSGGVERDDRVQAAINAVGGWPRIAQRTQDEEPRLVREFCDAYQASAA